MKEDRAKMGANDSEAVLVLLVEKDESRDHVSRRHSEVRILIV